MPKHASASLTGLNIIRAGETRARETVYPPEQGLHVMGMLRAFAPGLVDQLLLTFIPV